MKPEHVYLSDLKPSTKAYKVTVKLIEKSRPKTSPKKGIAYQSLVLEDEKGNKMRGALFGDQIEGYKDAFVYNGTYEIANAPIKPCSDQWKASPDELDYQMSFGGQAIIQPIDNQMGQDTPKYHQISQIPKSGDVTERFDVIGVVLYVEENARTVITRQNRETLVREIVITDHSSPQPLTISLWNDLAENNTSLMAGWAANFHIIGFTALRSANYKGFSMSSTMSTLIENEPTGECFTSLLKWAAQQKETLIDRQKRVVAARNLSQSTTIITIKELKDKLANTTLQWERHRLKVVIPKFDMDKINAYLGCSNCYSNSGIAAGETYDCVNCSYKACISVPRVTFSCDVTDGTGTLQITVFTVDSEMLFKMTAADIFKMRHSEDYNTFEAVKSGLSKDPFVIEVGPKTTLMTNNILQWVLKRVIIEEEPNSQAWNEADTEVKINSVKEPLPGGDNTITSPVSESNAS